MNKVRNAVAVCAFVAVMAVSMTISTSFPIYAQTTEDDGYVYPDNASPDEKKKIDKDEQKQWEDAGKPGDNNNNDNSKSNDNDDLPICEYKVVRDCVVNELGQTCLVGTSDDPCQDIFYGYDGANFKPGEKVFNNDKDNNDNDDHMAAPQIKDSNGDGMDDTATPYCDLVRDAYPDYTGNCWDRKDYSDSTGLYPCRDGTNVADWRNCK
jgi:hypothetical protein